MTRISILFLFLTGSLFLCLLTSKCYYDNEETLYPVGSPDSTGNRNNSGCDTSNVTFSATIKPLLSTYCYVCHSNANSAFGGNIKLENYADVVAHSDRLLGSIQQKAGYFPMPQGGTKLNNCQIARFQKWINDGKPNN